MIRTIVFLLFAIAFLVLGLPVLGVEWLLRKVWKKGADLSTLRHGPRRSFPECGRHTGY